jgi:phage tail-like protein
MVSYPLPAFHFSVDFGGGQQAFAEVSGLNIENQAIEYRDGLDPIYSVRKMPGIPKYGNITCKRGIFAKNNAFYEWLNTIKLNKVGDNDADRRDITISLLNENHEPVMNWKATRAFPVKIEGPSLKATGNEVAMESIEIAHEGLTIEP